MAVRRKEGRWLVEFMQSGHRIFRRLPSLATRQDALDYEGQLRREIFDQAVLGKAPNVTIEYAIKEWLKEVNTGRKSEKATESHAQRVIGACGDLTCQQAVEAGQRVRENSTRSDKSLPRPIPIRLCAATTNRRLCILKAVAKFAWKKGWTSENLSARISLLPENNARQTFLSQAQAKALIDATPARSRAYVALAVFTGARQAEILALLEDDCTEKEIRIRDSKTGEPRRVPLVPDAKPFLVGVPFGLHKRTYYGDFEKARAAIGMPHLHYHDLRHTTASLMIQAGVHINTVGEILGHKSVQTTRRYAHLSEGNKREALNKAFPQRISSASAYPVNEDK